MPLGPLVRRVDGLQGKAGADGMGLTLREFAIGQSYKKGDYVFSTTESGVSTMAIAKSNDFVAAEEPKDEANWVPFHTPRRSSRSDGTPGSPGVAGRDGAWVTRRARLKRCHWCYWISWCECSRRWCRRCKGTSRCKVSLVRVRQASAEYVKLRRLVVSTVDGHRRCQKVRLVPKALLVSVHLPV